MRKAILAAVVTMPTKVGALIPLQAMAPAIATDDHAPLTSELAGFDADGDGELSASELVAVDSAIHHSKETVTLLKCAPPLQPNHGPVPPVV